MRINEISKITPRPNIKFKISYLGDGDQIWSYKYGNNTAAITFIYADYDEDYVEITADMTGRADTSVKGAVDFFSTVLSAVQQFVRKERPRTVQFSTTNPSRDKLYRRLTGEFVKKNPKWHLSIDTDDDFTYFVLEKK